MNESLINGVLGASELVYLGMGIAGISGRVDVEPQHPTLPKHETPRFYGMESSQVLFAGPSLEFAGMDQLNVRLPRSLMGRGETDVTLTVSNRIANLVRVDIR
jgi:uncharacterized protein (TIGR03437 family)